MFGNVKFDSPDKLIEQGYLIENQDPPQNSKAGYTYFTATKDHHLDLWHIGHAAAAILGSIFTLGIALGFKTTRNWIKGKEVIENLAAQKTDDVARHKLQSEQVQPAQATRTEARSESVGVQKSEKPVTLDDLFKNEKSKLRFRALD